MDNFLLKQWKIIVFTLLGVLIGGYAVYFWQHHIFISIHDEMVMIKLNNRDLKKDEVIQIDHKGTVTISKVIEFNPGF